MKWFEYLMALLFLSMLVTTTLMLCGMGLFYMAALPLGGMVLLMALLISKVRRKDDNT